MPITMQNAKQKISVVLESNSKLVKLEENLINVTKLRVTKLRYNTIASGGRNLWISVQGFDNNPIHGGSGSRNSYTMQLPIFSGVGLDIVYINEDSGSFDVQLTTPINIKDFQITCLINNAYNTTDITTLNTVDVELYFE